ncbi:MAG: PDZ domain-containing protein [Planctomycetia bacterium]|nr:PDZ domain-containing protein [Planctomycetia bacterium]
MLRILSILAIALAPTLALPLFAPASTQPKPTREDKVRDDKKKVEADGFWIYNNLPKAFEQAKKDNKPIIVALRCIPCEECVKLDDNLVDKDPTLRPLLEKFVRVRVVSTNNLDLSIFQFDYDQSFAVFLLNADGTIYGRFGTRSHRTNWVGDVSTDGLAKAMQGALDLHAEYPKNKDALAAKRGPKPLFAVPEKFPTLGKYGPELDYKGKVVPSCIHCHQIGDAVRDIHRKKKEPLPEEVLFPYPHPKSQGLILNPKERATVLKVEKDSPAEKSGFKPGDQIKTLNGQPLLSIADVQWILHNTPADAVSIKAEVIRDGKPGELVFALPKGWRQRDDISWRSGAWPLRRMATGGMLLEEVQERPAGVPKTGMALRAKHVGQFGPHAAAKNAGFLVGDIIISFDGKTDFARETDLLAYALRTRKPGEKVQVKFVRNGKMMELPLPMQE